MLLTIYIKILNEPIHYMWTTVFKSVSWAGWITRFLVESNGPNSFLSFSVLCWTKPIKWL